MNPLKTTHSLGLALLACCGLGASGPLMAQAAGTADVQARSQVNTQSAFQDARAADQDARAAREAAEQAAAERRAGALTPRGQAQAEYSAWEADQASRRAERAAHEAKRAANQTGAASTAAQGGYALPNETLVQSHNAAGNASAASSAARQAALDAQMAAETARVATNAPPTPPAPPATPLHTYPSVAQVTVTSSPPDSVVGAYRIDMAALDTNGDGRLSGAEARANPTLSAEFAAVDNNGDGVLDTQELRGWMR
ncbi:MULTISPECIES: hypothetical protein [unclassified Luteimonas]